MKTTDQRERPRQPLSFQSLVALTFLFAIGVGTILLCLPVANTSGQMRDVVSALFTSTSATCVTGLSVIDIGAELTRFGQTVVLMLMQLGGVGITTFGTFLLVLVGRRLSIQSEFVLMDAYGVEAVKGLRSLLLWIVGFSLCFEGIGTVLIWGRFMAHAAAVGTPISNGEAFYQALFLSVSAFCNAGFALQPDSLMSYKSDPVVLTTVSTLVVAGGLGFLVLYNIVTIKFWRRNRMARGRITLHTKIVLVATLALLVMGTTIFVISEWGHTLKELSFMDKMNCALFQGVAPRTAGFNVVPMSKINDFTQFMTTVLMLIGGSPGSAAGGIKTTTLVVLIMTVIAMCRNRRDTVLFNRSLSYAVIREAIVIFVLALSLVALAYGVLLLTEAPVPLGDAPKLMFETVSALATVGLSLDHTGSLSTAGRCVIIVCMYVGRLGPLAVALLIGTRDEGQRIRYPEEEVVVG